jgi:superfamily II DNA/RNA helicase
MGREERTTTQESFRHDPEVKVLLATDAAGEGINLQRAHLMVNYDLPWNPNRIEQRFGRIHRIGLRKGRTASIMKQLDGQKHRCRDQQAFPIRIY